MDDRTIQLPSMASLATRDERPTGVPTVILYDGDEIGALRSLSADETVIGRTAGCDIVVPETRVSRRHAVLRRVAPNSQEFELVDLNSTNGTFLNGVRIDRALLRNGDKFGIGDRIFKFSLLDAADLAYQSRIVEMIHVDELTGLLTKRSLFRAFEKEVIRSTRYRHPLAVLMMDLDHFKQVNDSYGHLAGSHCLSEVGRVIRENTRVVDLSGRYGGEEFITVLPETSGEDGMTVADRIREAVGAMRFRHQDIAYQVKISIGVSGLPAHGTSVETLVQAADVALYKAKRTGRDRCVLYTPDLAGPGGSLSSAG
jgi:diguanylate cyclase (GGDEF)-like protein